MKASIHHISYIDKFENFWIQLENEKSDLKVQLKAGIFQSNFRDILLNQKIRKESIEGMERRLKICTNDDLIPCLASQLENVKKEDDVTLYSKEHLYYYEIFRKHFDAPSKLNQSATQCPDCKSEFNPDLPAFTTRRYGLEFCRMCGRFPYIK